MSSPELVALLASVVAGYLMGSVPFAYLAGRAVGVNILSVGTRNPGAANVFRLVSRRLGAAVFLADVLKGAAAVIAALAIGVPTEVAPVAGAAAVAGHWQPVFLRFRGGAGLATAVGTAVAVAPVPGGIGIAVGLMILPLLRSSGHAAAAGLVALAIAGFAVRSEWASTSGAIGLAAMVFARHVVIEVVKRRRT